MVSLFFCQKTKRMRGGGVARPRSPNRDKALQLWLASGKSRLLKDIADELQVSEELIRKWKNQDKWDKVTLPKGNSNVTNRKGGQPGNKNAVGHGGTGPPGNKNAVKTGEFETLFFDCLEPEERQLVDAVPVDKEQLLLQEIQLLTVRERRMLQRINNLRQAALDYDGEKAKGMTAVKYRAGTEKDKYTDLVEYSGVLGQIQAIEDALTRVQARKQAAIDSMHRYGVDDARLELELMKLDLASLKLGGGETETEDDGFVNALGAEIDSLWGDADEN